MNNCLHFSQRISEHIAVHVLGCCVYAKFPLIMHGSRWRGVCGFDPLLIEGGLYALEPNQYPALSSYLIYKRTLCNRCRPSAEQARWKTVWWRRSAPLWGITLASVAFSTCGCIRNCCLVRLLFVRILGVCDLLWTGHQQHHHVWPSKEVLGQAVCGFGCKNTTSHLISCSILQFWY